MKAAVTIILVLGVLLPAGFAIREREALRQINKKEHPLRSLYPFCRRILRLTVKLQGTERQRRRRIQWERLYCSEDSERAWQLRSCKQAAAMLAVCELILFLLAVMLWSSTPQLINNSSLMRPKLGSGDKQVTLQVDAEDKTLLPETERFELTLTEEAPDEQQRMALFERAWEYLWQEMFYEGEDGEAVRTGLHLVERIPNTQLVVHWQLGSYTYLNTDGTRNQKKLPEKGELLPLVITVSGYGEEQERQQYIRLLPQLQTEEEVFLSGLMEAVEQAAETDEPIVALPQEWNGVGLIWAETPSQTIGLLLLAGAVLLLAIPAAMDAEDKQQWRLRNRQLILDYPELVERLLLLLGAGLTLRGAWNRMTDEYLQNKNNGGGNRYVYEEMLLSRNEMENGCPEAQVYERFGKRCQLLAYLRFSSITVQNLKRGAAGILPLLETEAESAFAERLAEAKRLGEEAGTKLLAPMIMMLAIVFALVLIPAFFLF